MVHERSVRAKNYIARVLLPLASVSVAVSLFVLYKVIDRDPLREIELYAYGTALLSALVAVLAWQVVRRSMYADFQAHLIKSFFEEVDDPVLFVNRHGRPQLMNPAAQRFIHNLEQPALDQLAAHLLREDTEGFDTIKRMALSLQNMQPDYADLLITGESNEMLRLMVSSRPIPGHKLSILRLVDLSSKGGNIMSADSGLSRLIQLLDHVPIGLYVVDDHGKIIGINSTLSKWLGSKPSEIVSMGYAIDYFIVSSKGEESSRPIQSGEGETTQAEEVALKAFTGKIFHAFLGRVSVQRKDKKLFGGLVLREDVSEGDWQSALRRSKLLFKRFFEEAPLGIVLVDLDGRITESNRIFRDLMSRDVVGDLIASCVAPESRDSLAQKMAEAISIGDTKEPVEITIMSDPVTYTSLYVGRMEDDQETAFGLMLHFIDVTEQKNLEQQFVQSQKMQAVGQLAGGIAHDFNNLLTAMIGFCDLLLTRHRPGDPSFADINQIKQNANRASNLVRQLLAFSRQQKLDPKVINLTDVLVEITNLIKRLIGENIQLDIIHERDLWPVKVDQGQFEQVVVNLAVNARDAMGGKGDLTIQTFNTTVDKPVKNGAEIMPAGEYVQINVADTGSGISKDIIGRIFEPFFSTKEVGSGTGLGLSTVYGIIKQTDGHIFVESKVGVGTTFRLFIPRHKETRKPLLSAPEGRGGERPMLAPPPAITTGGAEEDLTGTAVILFAEDEDPVRKFTTRALESKGYKIMAGNSGEAALKLLKDYGKPIDLLLTDVMMPGMDGPTLIDNVRRIQPDVKVLCISGYSEDTLRKRITNDTGINFLAKPFSLKDIASKVKQIIESEPLKSRAAGLSDVPPLEEENDRRGAPKFAPPRAPASVRSAPFLEELARDVAHKVGLEQTAETAQDTSSSPASSSPPPPVPAARGAQKVILFADDEEAVRAFATRALEARGYSVIQTASAKESRDVLSSGVVVDMVITDLMMPDMDAPDFMAHVNRTHLGTPVLFVSGYGEGTVKEKLGTSEPINFLGKPFSLSDLINKVQSLLD